MTEQNQTPTFALTYTLRPRDAAGLLESLLHPLERLEQSITGTPTGTEVALRITSDLKTWIGANIEQLRKADPEPPKAPCIDCASRKAAEIREKISREAEAAAKETLETPGRFSSRDAKKLRAKSEAREAGKAFARFALLRLGFHLSDSDFDDLGFGR